MRGSIQPTDWFQERVGRYVIGINLAGDLVVGDQQNDMNFDLPDYALFAGLYGSVVTAPVGSAAIFDVEKTANLSDYYAAYDTTLPDIDDGEQEINDGSRATPNGEYAYRCFAPNDYVCINVDQVGSGTAGADFTGTLLFYIPINEWTHLTLTP